MEQPTLPLLNNVAEKIKNSPKHFINIFHCFEILDKLL